MPLPQSNTAWPPAHMDDILASMRVWDAWWCGDPSRLSHVYAGARTTTRIDRPSQYRGGVTGAVSRMFWGRPVGDLTRQSPQQLHIPIAADIARAAADLLYSEAPTFTVDDDTTQERLDTLVDDGMLSVLSEGTEIGSTLGGHYLRVTWDEQMRPDAPFFSLVDADAAYPEFQWGMLKAVTFSWVVHEEGNTRTRHLERHELDAQGNGVILHGLFKGTDTSLGVQVPITEHPSTASLELNSEGALDMPATRGLAVTYFPNVTPQRLWRSHPVGRHLGRSDLDGIEGEMDSLDEAWTSWMRDIRLGKARVFVARSLLESTGPGAGAYLDMDAEVFTPVNALASGQDGNLPITPQQFAIRYQEHAATCEAILLRLIRTAGYSPATFGLGDEGQGGVTATEVVARENRSLLTRDRKLRIVRPRLADAIEKLLAVDAALFSKGVKPARPDVQFPDGIQDSQLTRATTAQTLRLAQAASTRTLVAMVNPEWDDKAIEDEAARIMQESALPVLADPADPSLAEPDRPTPPVA